MRGSSATQNLSGTSPPKSSISLLTASIESQVARICSRESLYSNRSMANASPPLSPGAAAAGAGTGRLLSLDVFRGATILAMILVNNPGAWGAKSQYWPLDHAEWHGWTPTDLIFPFFLFIVGTSLAYSLRKYRSGAQ